jgi:hypothetical protein
VIASTIREFLPCDQILNYLEAVVRVYNRWGRRDNAYKARIKILVKAEGQRYIDEVEAEYREIVEKDGAPHTIPQAELDRVSASFVPPALVERAQGATKSVATVPADRQTDYQRWLKQNVATHKNPQLRAVTLSFKRLGQAPGDADADQLDTAAAFADEFSAGEAPRHPRPESGAALGRSRAAARTVARRPRSRFCQSQHPPADRHDCLPRRRFLRAGQCPLDPDRRSHYRALPGHGRAVRPGRD